MNLHDKLTQTTNQAKQSKAQEAKQEAEQILQDLEETLLEIANNGENKAEFSFPDQPQEVLQELQKQLSRQGLVVDLLKNKEISVAWDVKGPKKPLKGEIFRWYDLVNTIDEYNSKVSFSSTDFDEVKREMSNHSDWYNDAGTGQIIAHIVTKKDGIIKSQANEVYNKR